MQQSIYSALFGALSNEHNMNMITNNLANVNTSGYKRDEIAFEDVFTRFAHDYFVDSKEYLRGKPLWPEADIVAQVRLAGQQTDFTQGAMKVTGNPLDFAISGEGFFKVQTSDGSVMYTRNGNFMTNVDGQIIDSHGNSILGDGGPITVPGNARITVDQAGQIRANGDQVGQFEVVTFNDLGAMEKVGHNLYRPRAGNEAEIPVLAGQAQLVEGQDSPVVQATVNQGYLESSNVEVVTEMVRMINTNRSFEAYQKIISGTDQIDKKLNMIAQRA